MKRTKRVTVLAGVVGMLALMALACGGSPVVATVAPVGQVSGPTATPFVLPPTFSPAPIVPTEAPPTLTPAPTRTPAPTSDGSLIIGGGGDDSETPLVGGLPGSRPEFSTPTAMTPSIDPSLPLVGAAADVNITSVQRIEENVPVSGSLESDFDADEAHNWVIEGRAGQFLEVAIIAEDEVDLWLYDSDGNLLTGDINDGLIVFVYKLPSTGDYTVQPVADFFGSTYTLRVRLIDSDLPFHVDGEPVISRNEDSTSISGTNVYFVERLQLNTPTRAEFARDFTAHSWVFSGQAGQTLTITLDVDDMAVDVLAPGDVWVNGWLNETTMTMRLEETGEFTVRLDKWTEGPYTIEIRLN